MINEIRRDKMSSDFFDPIGKYDDFLKNLYTFSVCSLLSLKQFIKRKKERKAAQENSMSNFNSTFNLSDHGISKCWIQQS